MQITDQLESLQKLRKDIRIAAITLSDREARYLVDTYYQMQENRIRADGQVRAFNDSEEPHDVITWFSGQAEALENQVKRALDAYSGASELGKWARSQKGIGPVLAAGLLAHIDLTKAPTVGHIWNFAGLNPDAKWNKGEKRPWNAGLKVVCWKMGESFVKVCNNEEAFYGKLYAQRKEQEMQRNEALAFKEQAERILAEKKIGKTTDAYKAYSIGKLPPAHIHARAKRYAVKLFLAHYHEVGRKLLGLDVPNPYPIAILGHAHKIGPN